MFIVKVYYSSIDFFDIYLFSHVIPAQAGIQLIYF